MCKFHVCAGFFWCSLKGIFEFHLEDLDRCRGGGGAAWSVPEGCWTVPGVGTVRASGRMGQQERERPTEEANQGQEEEPSGSPAAPALEEGRTGSGEEDEEEDGVLAHVSALSRKKLARARTPKHQKKKKKADLATLSSPTASTLAAYTKNALSREARKRGVVVSTGKAKGKDARSLLADRLSRGWALGKVDDPAAAKAARLLSADELTSTFTRERLGQLVELRHAIKPNDKMSAKRLAAALHDALALTVRRKRKAPSAAEKENEEPHDLSDVQGKASAPETAKRRKGRLAGNPSSSGSDPASAGVPTAHGFGANVF